MFDDNKSLLKFFNALFVFLYVAMMIVLGVISKYINREELALGTALAFGALYHLICFFISSILMTVSFSVNGYTSYRWVSSIVIELATLTAILSLYGFNLLSDMGPQFALIFYVTIMIVASKLDTNISFVNMFFVPVLYSIFVFVVAVHTHAKPENKLSLPIYISVFFPMLKLLFQQFHFRFRNKESEAKVNPEDNHGGDVEEASTRETMQEAGERLEKHIKEQRRDIYMDILFHAFTFLFVGTVSVGFILVTI